LEGENLGELVLKPSRIFTRAVVDMIGGFEGKPQAEVHGVAHITGGGIPGKLGRILKPRNLGAEIEDPFRPGKIVLYCQELGRISDEEAYQTWNMGQGMIIITPEPNEVIKVARKYNLEAKVIGKVTSNPGITIVSQGMFKKNKILKFI
jgi:phosphoribosylformylglycinamidine cyclo-ligase